GRERPHTPGVSARPSAGRTTSGHHWLVAGAGGRKCIEDCARAYVQWERSSTVNNLLVMKFGGTSMGSAERMRVAADIIARQRQKQPVLVVVSAMSKVTDLLLDTL